ncbi:MAG: radical SAM protein [Magnetococcales bacterium]|nr:radical SAM protein [Magnetococcales bacterium]
MRVEHPSSQPPFPGVVRIEPASACNLACSHCPTGTVSMERGIMKRETFVRVMERLRPIKDRLRVVVLYHGGEPFMNKRFVEMLKEIKRLGVPFIKTISNGMLLSDGLIEGVLDHGLDEIEFSLDGLSAEESERIRRKSESAQVIARVCRLLDARRARRGHSLRVCISHNRFLEPGGLQGRVSPSTHVASWLRQAFSRYEGEVIFKSNWAMVWPHMEVDPALYEIYTDPHGPPDRTRCEQLDETLTIGAGGDVLACCYDLTAQLVMGRIQEQSLEEIWEGGRYRALRQGIADGSYPSICQYCSTVRRHRYLVMATR